jgi:hypothetical protein
MRNALITLIFVGLCTTAGNVLAQATRATAKSVPGPIYPVSRPTLISSIVVTQSEVDSSGDVSEALADYQFYLARAIAVLKHHGVRIHLTNDSTVRWRDSLGVHSISAADSGGVLYLFVSPNGRMQSLRQGVESEEAILEVARKQFGSAIPASEQKSDQP